MRLSMQFAKGEILYESIPCKEAGWLVDSKGVRHLLDATFIAGGIDDTTMEEFLEMDHAAATRMGLTRP